MQPLRSVWFSVVLVAGIVAGCQQSASNSPTASNSPKSKAPDRDDPKVAAAFTKLSEDDRNLAGVQGFCAVLKDSKLGSMGTPVKVMVEGQPVFLCCESCRKDALADPKETLAKVEKLKQAKTGPSRD